MLCKVSSVAGADHLVAGAVFDFLGNSSVIESVSLAQGEVIIGSSEIEVWTRLLFHFSGGGSLEIFNTLDENGFEFHYRTIHSGVLCC